MRAWLLAVVALAIGVSVGVGVEYARFGVQTTTLQAAGRIQDKLAEGVPQVVVENGESHNFGTMEKGATMTHKFIVKNAGTAPLTLEVGEKTCKCTVGEMTNGKLLPGESTDIRVEWTPTSYSPEFSQQVQIKTNDPLRRSFHLVVRGVVEETIRTVPSSVELGNIPTTESRTAEVRVYNLGNKPLSLSESSFVYDSAAEHYELSVSDLGPEDLKQEPRATEGKRLQVTVKPGLPLGSLRQAIRLKFDREDEESIEVPINGQIVSDISVIGPRNQYHAEHNVLSFGPVKQKEGTEARLVLLVKGPHREEVEFSIREVSPDDVIEASLGEKETTAGGAVAKQSLTIRVPRGARAVSYMGIRRNELGRVVLATTHPDLPELTIYVKFVVTP